MVSVVSVFCLEATGREVTGLKKWWNLMAADAISSLLR